MVRPRFLDLAKVRFGGRFHETAVDDVRAVGSMLALFASLLPYWLVYFQVWDKITSIAVTVLY